VFGGGTLRQQITKSAVDALHNPPGGVHLISTRSGGLARDRPKISAIPPVAVCSARQGCTCAFWPAGLALISLSPASAVIRIPPSPRLPRTAEKCVNSSAIGIYVHTKGFERLAPPHGLRLQYRTQVLIASSSRIFSPVTTRCICSTAISFGISSFSSQFTAATNASSHGDMLAGYHIRSKQFGPAHLVAVHVSAGEGTARGVQS